MTRIIAEIYQSIVGGGIFSRVNFSRLKKID
jgi:hypothetical protein